MALSTSVHKAQTLKLCQFCEESPEIKYKCVHCDLLLCQLCNSTLHRKKAYSGHEVINLKDHGTTEAAETIRKVDLKNMPCDIHTGQKCCVYCSECEEPICPECLTQTHNNHKFIELKEVYNKVTSEIVAFKEMVENDLKFFQEENKQLKSSLSKGEQTFEATRTKILQQEVKLKEAVSKQSKELLHKLEIQWHPTEENLKKEIKKVEKSTENLESRKTCLELVLHSHQIRDFFTSEKYLDKNLPTKTKTNIQTVETVFIPKNNHANEMLFGSLYQVPKLEVVQSYQTDLPGIMEISILDEHTTFIGSFTGKKLLKISFEKDNIKVLSEVKDIKVFDMAVTNNRDVLISTRSNEIKLYQDNGLIKTFYSFSPLFTLGLHVTEQNEILVGLTDSSEITPSKPDSIRKVVSLTTNGDIKHTYEYDQHNERLLTRPRRITSNNSFICVAGYNENLEGIVVTIDKGGQLLWTYTGYNTKTKQKFCPKDIQFTMDEVLLISDCDNHTLHVLNIAGETIAGISVRELGIELPFSLNIDKNGFLLIGCIFSVRDKDKKAMIHKLKFT